MAQPTNKKLANYFKPAALIFDAADGQSLGLGFAGDVRGKSSFPILSLLAYLLSSPVPAS